MSAFPRSGLPHHINGTTAATTLQKWDCPVQTMQLVIDNIDSALTLEVLLTKDAADKKEGDPASVYGYLIQPGVGADLRTEVRQFWTYSSGMCDFQALAIGRT